LARDADHAPLYLAMFTAHFLDKRLGRRYCPGGNIRFGSSADILHCNGHVHFSGSHVQGRRAYRNAAFSASAAKKTPPSDKANNLAVALSFIASELLC
jgi:hypothetical protein